MNATKKLEQMTSLLNNKLLTLEAEIFKDWPTDVMGKMIHERGIMLGRSLNLNFSGVMVGCGSKGGDKDCGKGIKWDPSVNLNYSGRVLYTDASFNISFPPTQMTNCDINDIGDVCIEVSSDWKIKG